MKKRWMAVLLALAVLLGAAGCGEKDRARPASEQPASPSSLEARGPEKDRDPEDGEADDSWPSQADDALVREIIKTYGAEEQTLPGESEPTLVAKDAGLFLRRSSWDRVDELSDLDYYCWFLTTTYDEDPAYKEEHYAHPLGEDRGWFFPQDLYEERVRRYFRVSPRELRNDLDYPCYDPALGGYTFGLAVGIGERPAIRYSYTQEGAVLSIDVALRYENDPSCRGRLQVFLQPDGGWHYMGWQYRPDPIPQEGKKREEVDFLTPGQWELLDKAGRYYAYFTVSAGSFDGDSGWQAAAPSVEVDGVEYLKYTGSLYGGWEDFYRDMCSVFTPEYFEVLNDVDFGLWGEEMSGPLYRNIDGDLYCSVRDGGGNPSYLPEEDRYFKQLADENTVLFSCRSFYCEREDVMSEHPVPTSMKERSFRLVNGPEGWRVAKYARP